MRLSIANSDDCMTMPDGGPELGLITLSRPFSSPEMLRALDERHERPIYVVQCRDKHHALAKVYETPAGRVLDLPEAVLSQDVVEHLVATLKSNEGKPGEWTSEDEMPRVMLETPSNTRFKRMCVPLYKLTDDMLGLTVPLTCTCSWNMSLTFGDFAKRTGHETLKNQYPPHRRKNTDSEIVYGQVMMRGFRYLMRLKAKGLSDTDVHGIMHEYLSEGLPLAEQVVARLRAEHPRNQSAYTIAVAVAVLAQLHADLFRVNQLEFRVNQQGITADAAADVLAQLHAELSRINQLKFRINQGAISVLNMIEYTRMPLLGLRLGNGPAREVEP